MIRRILLVACTLLFISAAPAAADHEYGHVLSEDVARTEVVVDRTAVVIDRTAVVFTAEGDVTAAEGGTLARTGANSIVPLVQAAIVLIGGGSLLVLVARRRRAVRSPATA